MSTTNGNTDPREVRGIPPTAAFRLVQRGEDWIVPSQGGKGSYRVNLGEQHCTCPDHETNGNRCKHIIAAEIVYRRETAPDGTVTETKAVRLTYSQDWAAYNAAATSEKRHFIALLRELCSEVEQPVQTFGRPRLALADMTFAATYKVYSGFSSRRFTTDLREASNAEIIDRCPHFNSVSNYLSDPARCRS